MHPDTTEPADGPLVLVVDDEEAVRSVIGRLLSRQGYRVLLAASGGEGIKLFETHAKEIKLVVLDWHLPGDPGERTAVSRVYAAEAVHDRRADVGSERRSRRLESSPAQGSKLELSDHSSGV